MEIRVEELELGMVVKINEDCYEIISLEEDWWGDEKKGAINRGTIVGLHKIGDVRLGVPTPTHFLYFDNNTKELSFRENVIKRDTNVPEDVKLKNYISEVLEIPIKEINIE